MPTIDNKIVSEAMFVLIEERAFVLMGSVQNRQIVQSARYSQEQIEYWQLL